jgi:hypothetical protein
MKFNTKEEAEDYVRKQNAWSKVSKKEPKKMEVVEVDKDVFEIKED